MKRKRRRAPWRHVMVKAFRQFGCTALRFIRARMRSPTPKVILDSRVGTLRYGRGELARAARQYADALGTPLPNGLTVLVQRVVHDGRQLNGLLQTFDGPAGRRHVIHLALSVNGRPVAEDELLAAMRHQLNRLFQESIGKPILTMPLDLEIPRVRAGAPVVELRPDQADQWEGRRGGAAPFKRVEVQDSLQPHWR